MIVFGNTVVHVVACLNNPWMMQEIRDGIPVHCAPSPNVVLPVMLYHFLFVSAMVAYRYYHDITTSKMVYTSDIPQV
ncbi:MAG: hypothetical protein D6823_07830 [Chloroflexi bacterium]|nr:MAG: hypothetical protein D6823_07830 [Chloroflexota bacterium]